jgi:hypothetical protein
MEEFLQLITEPLKEVYTGLRSFIPNLLAMIIIIGAGALVSRLVRAAVLRFLKAVNFDSWSDRMGLTAAMRKADLWRKPAEGVASGIYWFLLIVTIMTGFGALKVQAIDNVVQRFFLYLPRVFTSLMILVLGYIIAGFIGRAVLIAAVNSGYRYARLLAEAVRLLLTVLILAMALEQLQVAPGIVVAAFSIIFGGIVLALAISFGVGGIDSAKRMIDREEESRKQEKDIEHL